MKKNVADRELHLVDMIWAVCAKWRLILICALIFAVLSGGYSYYRSTQTIAHAQQASQMTSEQMHLDEKSIQNAELYDVFKKQYSDYLDYMSGSLVMQLNPNAVWEGKISYYVDSTEAERKDVVSAVIAAYKMRLEQEEFTGKMAEVLKCSEEERQYVSELIICDDELGNPNATIQKGTSLEDTILDVLIYADSQEACENLLELAKENITHAQADIAGTIGSHALTIIDSTVNLVADRNLMEYQRDKNAKVNAMEVNLRGLRDRLSNEELQYAQLKEKEAQSGRAQTGEAVTEQASSVNPSISKKLTIVGFFLGAIVVVCLQVMLYIFDKRLRLEDAFEQNYEIPLLGNVITAEKGKKKWFFFIDALVTKMRHYGKHYFAEKEAVEMAAAGIRIAAKRRNTNKIFVTGAVMGEREQSVFAKLQDAMKNAEIELVCGNPLLYDAESLETIAEIGYVVLIEQAGGSLHKEILEEVEICKRQGIEMIGAIVVA